MTAPPLANLINELTKLPGVGGKSAARLAYHILKRPAAEAEALATAIVEVKQKIFRGDLAARDVYLMIAALGYFYLSNRYTLSAFLGEELDTPQAFAYWRGFIIDAVLRAVAVAAPAKAARSRPVLAPAAG